MDRVGFEPTTSAGRYFLSENKCKKRNTCVQIPTYNAIRLTCRRKGVYMDMRYCRKIFASWLHKHGISDVLIDLLQGRVGKGFLVNHYIQPGQDYRDKILDAVKGLKQEVEK